MIKPALGTLTHPSSEQLTSFTFNVYFLLQAFGIRCDDETTLMPDYFFHIGLELFPPSNLYGKTVESKLWPEGHQALSPFLTRNATRLTPLINKSKGQTNLSTNYKLKSPSQQNIHDGVGLLSQMPASYADDKRLDLISIEGTDMSATPRSMENAEREDTHINKGIGTSTNGLQTKGRYVPLDRGITNSAYGIVHLYRDVEEIQKPHDGSLGTSNSSLGDTDCTTLAILAVPSYMAPSDLLGFVGEKSREMISHFRMIRTARANRYMVLMKFRQVKEARRWREEWNGRLFNSMEVRFCLP